MDTFRLIGLFTQEANLEAEQFLKTATNFMDMKGKFIRGPARECGLAMYMLTK